MTSITDLLIVADIFMPDQSERTAEVVSRLLETEKQYELFLRAARLFRKFIELPDKEKQFYACRQLLIRRASELSEISVDELYDVAPVDKQSFELFVSQLEQVAREFTDFGFSELDGCVWASTESISFEGINLGPFRIVIQSGGEEDSDSYLHVEALVPNPARTSPDRSVDFPDIYHPHVQGDFVCLGEGVALCYKALAEYRFADAFHIVNAVLTNYSPETSYRQIRHWDNPPLKCLNCARTIDPEPAPFSCSRCARACCINCPDGLPECPKCKLRLCARCAPAFLDALDCIVCKTRSCSACLVHCDCCLHPVDKTCRAYTCSGRLCCDICLNQCCGCGGLFAEDEASGLTCPECLAEKAGGKSGDTR